MTLSAMVTINGQSRRNPALVCDSHVCQLNLELIYRLAEREERDWTTLAGFASSGNRSFEIRKMC